ncbi:High-potential iron-sulfur protein [Variovorax sp. PBL-H6]|uniref:high-potential iron-sulfur protein n=1 Tax=Variovorax sp. PBL-H6 TaxID=434009 RepID=UPI0013195C25|nr:high-potential iron-sulfur protein [Variovorax sp. PBL-H6]VTU27583.1 High-potential iron-sulfur protein [Variovorax sp. PBL-H6]
MKDSTRRLFILRNLAGGSAVLAFSGLARAAPARTEESDDTAQALGYRHDTSKVDDKRFPKHSATQRCTNCSFFQGSATDEWGGCAMFGRKQIAGPGWCNAWAAKPA